MHALVGVYVCICMYPYMYIYIYIPMCVCTICICIHICTAGHAYSEACVYMCVDMKHADAVAASHFGHVALDSKTLAA